MLELKNIMFRKAKIYKAMHNNCAILSAENNVFPFHFRPKIYFHPKIFPVETNVFAFSISMHAKLLVAIASQIRQIALLSLKLRKNFFAVKISN